VITGQYAHVLLSCVPWGYATRVYVILTSDTSTSTLPSIAVSVPSELPGGGEIIDFTPWAGIEAAVTKIDETEVETIDGSPLAMFEFYWNIMWSLVFAFWLMREFYSAYELGDFEDLEAYQSSHRRGGAVRKGLGAYKVLNDARRSSQRRQLGAVAHDIVNHRQKMINRYNNLDLYKRK